MVKSTQKSARQAQRKGKGPQVEDGEKDGRLIEQNLDAARKLKTKTAKRRLELTASEARQTLNPVPEKIKKVKGQRKDSSKEAVPVHKGQPVAADVDLPSKHKSSQVFEDEENYVSYEVTGHLSDDFLSEEEEGELSEQVHEQNLNQDQRSESRDQTTSDSQHTSDPGRDSQSLHQPVTSEGEEDTEDTPEAARPSTSGQGRSHQPSSQDGGSRKLEQTVNLMRGFMIDNGFINDDMNPEDICEFIKHGQQEGRNENDNASHDRSRDKGRRRTGGGEVGGNWSSPSEITVYKDAVCMPNDEKNISNSSDELINTSDESMGKGETRVNDFVRYLDNDMVAGTSHRDNSRAQTPDQHSRERGRSQERRARCKSRDRSTDRDHRRRERSRDSSELSPNQLAERLIWEAENAKAKIHNSPGNTLEKLQGVTA